MLLGLVLLAGLGMTVGLPGMTTRPDLGPSAVPLDLVAEMRRLVVLAGSDENAAIAQFHRLVYAHGRARVGAALAAAAPQELCELGR